MNVQDLRSKIAMAIAAGYGELRPEDVDPDACWYAADHVIALLVSELTGLEVGMEHHPTTISPGLMKLTSRSDPEYGSHSMSFVIG